jgi:hypothetical protein
MGVSAVGERGISPRTVPVLGSAVLLCLALLVYVFGPPLVPGLRSAAADRCNQMVGGDFRSFRLDWKAPWHPTWDLPHWSCRDIRTPGETPVSFGWWVNPF